MLDVPLLSALYIPDAVLERLANRDFTFVAQRYHFLVRLIHILSASAFFGAVCLLDLRLMGFKSAVPVKTFAHMMPWLYASFWVAMLSGLFLFFYAPVPVGSHAFFAPKMILLAAGAVNTVIFNRLGLYRFACMETIPFAVKAVAAASLIFWLGVMVCSSLNAESVPKVILR